MSRIDATFAALRERRAKALIPYLTAGDPHADTTAEIMRAMAAAGADVIELGVPFSDPMADGPVIQQASERALARGIGLAQVLQMVRDFRAADSATPVVLMGYANPIERYGVERFVADAKGAGVDGVLVVDYPPEECTEFAQLLRRAGIDPVFLVAPTSSDARIASVAEAAGGYVYHVSLKGVTGAGHFDIDAVKQMIPRIKAHVKLPVGVGFGIRDGATARAVADVADAVVIGSALVQLLEGAAHDEAPRIAGRFIASIRAALDA
jgi:tryptophan synthase alpha chain